jgi:hypothetical protein
MAISQAILEWQNSFGLFGITYSGAKDGEINQSFIEAMMALENKYKAYGEIFTGTGVRLTVADAKKKYLEPTSIVKTVPSTENHADEMKIWESFFNQNLPIVGKVYDGDLAAAAKKIESAISKSINKPMNGVIWNDVKKQFNTTPDDVKKALNVIDIHNNKELKQAKFTIDERVFKMSKILFEKNK